METIKKETDNKYLVFIGKEQGEYGNEMYLELKDNIRGWSFMGLRPDTEENLRRFARETEPEEILGLVKEEFNRIYNYFDFDKFADDMEEDWLDRHDSQATREENGETLYLGFGSGQDIFGYFKTNKITSFNSFCNHFEEVGIDKETFDKVYKVIQKHRKRDACKPVGDKKEERAREEELKEMKLALNY